jgi:PEP-CTERM motif
LISGPNAFSLSLRAADGPSNGPGTVLESFLVVGQMGPFGFSNPVIIVDSVSQPLLNAGASFWLVATADGNTVAAWNVNDRDIFGTYFSVQSGTELLIPNQLIGAYRVSATAVVPEPSTLLLLGAGIAWLAGVVWRRRCPRSLSAHPTRRVARHGVRYDVRRLEHLSKWHLAKRFQHLDLIISPVRATNS